ncbi:MAG: DUF938 domain-containing protein [Dokdonella sp.]
MTAIDKPCSPSCERNREPILAVLAEYFPGNRRVLEIGSGTGQHAVHFAAAMPQWRWQCSDRAENLAGIRLWLAEAALPNTPEPIELDVASGNWPGDRYNAVFSANTLHIMGWDDVQALFGGLPDILKADARVVIYGPFNDDGQFSSESNAQFDQSLKARASQMGLRDQSAVDALAQAAGLQLIAAVAMPANNRCLVWQRVR